MQGMEQEPAQPLGLTTQEGCEDLLGQNEASQGPAACVGPKTVAL